MKLRWLTKRSQVTADDVRCYLERNEHVSMMEAKRRLENVTGPVLQYFDKGAGVWVDVPHVTEYRSVDDE